ncbi:hypothetical protein [Micromonospora sp. CPCC 206061]|uniref:hypothetical protein n=1 Tax=Micromonospora sp. CPCC 206061 TaxID=3122410 RepID=UPI002FF0FDD7
MTVRAWRHKRDGSHAANAPMRQWPSRLLLLALVSLAVAALHTVGHQAAGTVARSDGHAVSVLATPAAPGGPCTDLCTTPDGCLFVLTTAGVLILLAARVFAAGKRAALPALAHNRYRWFSHRAPPWTPISLQLATTSVLRT